MTQFVSRFAKNESGATAIEYGLIAALIAVAIIAAVGALGDNASTAFQQTADAMAAG
jgi:pilus assembly protein Flp/PilA